MLYSFSIITTQHSNLQHTSLIDQPNNSRQSTPNTPQPPQHKFKMKFAIFSAALALAGSAAAAPTHPKIQAQILALENQIVTVINDIVQSSPNLKNDWNAGATQFGTLANKLDGPQPCSIFTPGTPKNAEQAIRALQTSQTNLMLLSLDLQNPANSIEEGDLHADVCTALQYYSSTSKFVGI